MKQYKSTVRMGALNLLVLIIAICLVVLSVLALVSANSMSSFTKRQEASVTEYYTQANAGQSFLDLLTDVWSEISPYADDDTIQLSVEGVLSAALSRASTMSGIDANGSCQLVGLEELYEMMGVPYSLHGKANDKETLSSLDSDAPDYTISVAKALEKCEKGVVMDVEMSSGRKLHAIIGLVKDGGIFVLEWKTTREWQAESEELWVPDENSLVTEEDLTTFESVNENSNDEEQSSGEIASITIINEKEMGSNMDVASSDAGSD